ncbi:HutD [Paraburkholderia caribensis MBA4]|uniref:HutD n=1 Tax=Paraburkholderia caribensis MBA4 TaxID=1323664 RepID=A0A0P0RKT8_9BURK|nr:HutD family protein [Paraburkholderia caribensis]ALL69334.1 HutD [Paraburkholderia caribensis MBA4]
MASVPFPDVSLPPRLAIQTVASIASQAWRNGGGTTRPLAEAATGDWRISLADVERDGPYSPFPGMDRQSLVVEGAGVELRNGTDTVLLEPGRPAGYNGEIEWQATLRDGPVVALNTMVKRDRFRARIVPLRDDMLVATGRFALVLPLHGRCAWRTTDRTAATLLASGAMLTREADGPDLSLTPFSSSVPGVAAVLVLIEPAAPHFSENQGTRI